MMGNGPIVIKHNNKKQQAEVRHKKSDIVDRWKEEKKNALYNVLKTKHALNGDYC